MKDQVKLIPSKTEPEEGPFPQIWIQDDDLHVRLKNDAHVVISQDKFCTVCRVVESGNPYKTDLILLSGEKLI